MPVSIAEQKNRRSRKESCKVIVLGEIMRLKAHVSNMMWLPSQFFDESWWTK
jgi:hypothetical protein